MNALARVWCAATICLLCSSATSACKVPVFRYALERWPADQYRIVAIVDEPDGETAEVLQAIERLRDSDANVEIEVVRLNELSEAELWQVEGLENTDETPLLQVYYPARNGQRKLCWSGELNTHHVNAWSDSPLRRQIASDIQSGVSAVWVVVEGSDEEQNLRLIANVEQAIDEAASEISIPEGVIRRQDAARYLKDNPSASMDDVLRSDIPLRIDFRIRLLKHDDADELALRAMIQGLADSPPTPFVFPVFGRGRMIEPLTMAQYDSQSVVGACRYMVGECSCSVKALSPGVDLLLNTHWQSHLGDGVVMIDASPTPSKISIPTGGPVAKAPVAKATTPPPTMDSHANPDWRRPALAGIALILLITAARQLHRKFLSHA